MAKKPSKTAAKVERGRGKKVKAVKARVWRGTGWVYDSFTTYRDGFAPGVYHERTPAFNTRVRITITEIITPITSKGRAGK